MRQYAAALVAIAIPFSLAACEPLPRPRALVESYQLEGCCSFVAIVDREKLFMGEDLPYVATYICQTVNNSGCVVSVYFTNRKAPAEGASIDDQVKFGWPDFVYNQNANIGKFQNRWLCEEFPEEHHPERECLSAH
jgi:hypothetical protein